ncbi:MAG: diguanylate cyclase [Chloroflexi bacterium]|nr:diguanylate cyclase [Chloroflexota bacterium]
MLNAIAALHATAPTAVTSLDEALDALFALAADMLRARRCSLYLRSMDGTSLLLRNEIGLTATTAAREAPTDETIVGFVARTRAPLLVQDVGAYPALPTHPERYATASFITVPILVENDAVGVLNATDRHDGHAFSDDDQRIAQEGEIDPITGLDNRRRLERRLTQEVARARQAGAPLTLLLFDVDSYTTVAANAGVQAAGALMRSVGELVGRAVRQSDTIALFESSQIAILLPATPLDRAWDVAHAILREAVHESLPAHLRYDCERLELSVGVAALDAATDDNLAQRAQVALRATQAQGKGIAVLPRDTPPRARQDTVAIARGAGVPYLANPAAVATEQATRLLSRDVARGHLCFPVAFENGTLTLAMADPTDAVAITIVSELTGMAVYPVASSRLKVLQAIGTLLPDRRNDTGDQVKPRPLRDDRDV